MGEVPRTLGAAAGLLVGGFLALTVGASVAYQAAKRREEEKRKNSSPSCGACRGRGFHPCKLCGGSSTISWSPLYDPISINPCLCPTCDGKKIQRCLNCIGKGYA